jgi:hypothetical protein
MIEYSTGAVLQQETLFRAALVSFFLISPIEEAAKLSAVWFGIYRREDFRRPVHGITYAVTAALGFATVENVVYLFQLSPSGLFSRLVYATPAHVLFSSMWGYSLGAARFKRGSEFTTILAGFLAASLLHGFYNFLVAFYPSGAMISLLPLMALMCILFYGRMKKARTDLPYTTISSGPVVSCPDCGAYMPIDYESCSRCNYLLHPLEEDAAHFCGKCRSRLEPFSMVCRYCGESPAVESSIQESQSV